MDLGISGKKAIVCGASLGLGFECAKALAIDGADVLLVARDLQRLNEAAKELTKLGTGQVTVLSADVTKPEHRASITAAQPHADILITNCGGPPAGNFRDWTQADWHAALDANMLGPIELIKMTIDGMIERKFGRVVNITSSAVKAPIAVLGLSNGARAGLTGFVAGLAREVAIHNVTINNLLPGPFETSRLTNILNAQAKLQGRDEQSVREEWLAAIPARKFGDPEEFGKACAFIVGMSHMTGQNILLDGGQFPGAF
jgi:3-oxoacyl-[acyl-carrier protein] reductase